MIHHAQKSSSRSRLISNEAVVCFSSIDWDFLWQQNQEIMLRLAQAGNQVLFIENTGIRAARIKDLPRLWTRLRNWWRSTRGFREQHPNLVILSPLLLPLPYSRAACWINGILIGSAIRTWLRATRQGSPVLWTFLPTPLVNAVIEDLEPAAVVYYSTADFAASSAGAAPSTDSEKELFCRADLVIATSKDLLTRARPYCRNVRLCPGGVDFKKFEAARNAATREPEDIASIPHPRLGYIGGIHRWVDAELLIDAARRDPERHIVLIGPEQMDVSRLREIPNIHLLGPKRHDELPSYIAAFDVGLIPYRMADYTASVYPTKLNEYFAMGVPVASTALPEVLAYDTRHAGLVRIARRREDFEVAVSDALAEKDERRDERIAAARGNSWEARLLEMSNQVREVLEAKRARPRVMTGLMRRLALRYRPALLWSGTIVTLLLASLLGTPLAWVLAEPLIVRSSGAPADAIVVLAGGVGESWRPGQGHEERMIRAIELYRSGFASKMVLCSGIVRTYSELEVMRAIALSQGVRERDIFLSSRGGGTRSMVEDALRVLNREGWQKILLVSSPYHMRRAAMVFQRQSPGLEVLPIPVARSSYYAYSASVGPRERPSPNPTQLRGILKEFLALAYYRLRGWI